MVKAAWGKKHTCPKCGTRFYDLGKKGPAVCIECEHKWVPEQILKSKQVHVAPPKPPEAPKEPEKTAEKAEDAADGKADDAADAKDGDTGDKKGDEKGDGANGGDKKQAVTCTCGKSRCQPTAKMAGFAAHATDRWS